MANDADPRTDEILHRLGELEARVDRLEVARTARAPGEDAAPKSDVRVVGIAAPVRAGGASSARTTVPEVLPFLGRTLFILAGAFLLRAATESGFLPPTLGSGIGVLYAGIWILLAHRHASRNERTGASLFGLAAAGIAFPLLWEATASFGFLAPLTAAVALAAISAGGFLVATWHRLAVLAAAYGLGAALTAAALAIATKRWPLFLGEVLLLTVVLMILPERRRWPLLEWSLSAASLGALMLMTVTLQVSPPERVVLLFTPEQLLWMQLGWVLAVMAALAWRTLRSGDPIDGIEILQGVASLAVGFGGALIVASAPDVGTAPVGWVSLALAAGCYGASFALADRRLGRRNFVFYSSVALLVTLIASASLLAPPVLTGVLALTGLGTAAAGAMRGRATLTLHAAVYVTSAAWVAGMLRASLRALVGADLPDPGWIGTQVLLVLAVAAVASWLPVAAHGRTWGRYTRLPKVLLELVLLAGVAAAGITVIATVALRGLEGAGHLAALDALRSGVIALTVVVVAALGRSARWPEAAWMVYPILGLGAAKLLLVDLPHGTPLSLVFSLVFYGGALIVAPRLTRDGGTPAD